MERNEYLKMCQRNSVLCYREKVVYNGVKYYPKSYLLWFDESGRPRHSAILLDGNKKNEIRCRLADVEACCG